MFLRLLRALRGAHASRPNARTVLQVEILEKRFVPAADGPGSLGHFLSPPRPGSGHQKSPFNHIKHHPHKHHKPSAPGTHNPPIDLTPLTPEPDPGVGVPPSEQILPTLTIPPGSSTLPPASGGSGGITYVLDPASDPANPVYHIYYNGVQIS